MAPDVLELANQIDRLKSESIQSRADIEKLKEFQNVATTDIKLLQNGQQHTDGLISQLLSRFNDFEAKIFEQFRQMTKDNYSLLQNVTTSGHKERTSAQQAWIGFAKYVIAGTIAAMITYLFTKI
ncbi:hypothetical protein YDYSY3_60810 [Paenibacillus chitinolyticus]|uniref:hypothetical protein n=1 Tax=Paenibacillus chitinolyticus TaxID=79263 RepID=UPI0026E4DD47|nr:hypothetical protein [Paenibacillus chitinolyticus]GKS15081.1 hypothetical protein YDYSY3_60810 [Paenibacillus chitinolyticus]